MDKNREIEEMKREVNIALARDCSKGKCLNCKFINEENCEPAIIAEHLYNAGYRKASEIAEEIFAEIEKLFFKNGVFIHIQSYNEFKKKYTEGEG